MILPFSTHWSKEMPEHLSGLSTYFVEKITAGLSKVIGEELDEYTSGICENLGYTDLVSLARKIVSVKPKKHTIREDSKNRWKAGCLIHFFINNQRPNMFRFAPVVEVVSVQRINIFKCAPVYTPYTYKTEKNGTFQVEIDGMCLNVEKLIKLSINDGFDTLDDFFSYFKDGFSGKLIHWTNIKY